MQVTKAGDRDEEGRKKMRKKMKEGSHKRDSKHFKPRKDCRVHLASLLHITDEIQQFHLTFNTNLMGGKKNEETDVERHRLSELSKVTKPECQD